MTTRRDFINTGAAAIVGAAALAAAGKTVGGTLAGSSAASARGATSAMFESAVGSEFSLTGTGANSTAKLRLTRIDAYGQKGPLPVSARKDPFSLVFSNETEAPLEQGTYTFSNEAIGEFSFYIGPVSQNPGVFEAVVN